MFNFVKEWVISLISWVTKLLVGYYLAPYAWILYTVLIIVAIRLMIYGIRRVQKRNELKKQ